MSYECALTGKVVGGEEEGADEALKDLPSGWTKITIQRRQINPRWEMLMQVQNAMIEGTLSQVPDEVRDLQRMVIAAQVEAQFHGLMKDTPMFTTDVSDEVFISDSPEVLDTLNELRELVGLKEMPAVERDGEQDEDDDDESKE